MIKLQDVTKIYEGSAKAVDSVSLEVQEGEIFGLIGTSGCGKTTTLKMINRLLEPTSGQILVDAVDVCSVPPERLRREIGYVIQSVGLFPHYTVRENIAVVPRLLGWPEERIEGRYQELMEIIDLSADEMANRRPNALSGGQQQRIGFARALAADPKIILMDEPFGALDPITKDQVRREFRQLLDRINKTIVLVTHDVQEAFELCDRVALMDAGRICQVGPAKELLLKPANEFVSSFFDSHRLELELQVVTIDDLMKSPTLRVTQEIEADARALAANPSTTIGHLLRTSTAYDYLKLERARGQEPIYVSVEKLLSEFHRLTAQAPGGDDD